MHTPESHRCTLPSGLAADVLVGGEGPPLVFLHGHQGRRWDAFLTALSQRFTVYAPQHPGAEDPDELLSLDAFSDLCLYYDDLFRALGVERPLLVGHGFGGMVAAELAASQPDAPSALVLIGSLGLWIDEDPVTDISTIPAEQVPATLCSDPGAESVRELFAMPDDPQAMGELVISKMTMLAAVNHFIWPIPDRELRRRLYRIAAPTLLVWGRDDRFVPASYAGAFLSGISNAKTLVLEGAGHYVQLERPEEVVSAISDL